MTRSLSSAFPAFCTVLVGSYTVLQWAIQMFLMHFIHPVPTGQKRDRSASSIGLSRFVAGFLASYYSFRLLDHQPDEAGSTLSSPKSTKNVSKTIEMTMTATVRALDTALGYAWSMPASTPQPTLKQAGPLSSSVARGMVDVLVFASSAGVVMWSWFYWPQRMSLTYRKWIKEAAQIDHRLVEVLRLCRDGKFRYGLRPAEDGLQRMCIESGWPLEWASPQSTIPLPCELVHMHLGGSSCIWHAGHRFRKAFQFAMTMYLPLQLLAKLRKPSQKTLGTVLNESCRSSTFLAAFISLFYYSICLSRTLIGPQVLGKRPESHQLLDSGVCVGAGCIACGWSVLLEKPERRAELALFVAPKAFGVYLPKSCGQEVQKKTLQLQRPMLTRLFQHSWGEQVVFGLAIGFLLAATEHDPRSVRGIFGQIFHIVLK